MQKTIQVHRRSTSPVHTRDSEMFKLFIYDLHKDVRDAQLLPLLNEFKPIYCNVVLGKKGGSRGFAFAMFRTKEDAESAIDKLQVREG
jgi:RNA recognition motif-containing protein